MSGKAKNPPAFPAVHAYPDDRAALGMSLRDYFAAAVMQGMLACPGEELGDQLVNAYARQSFRVADAMLKARQS